MCKAVCQNGHGDVAKEDMMGITQIIGCLDAMEDSGSAAVQAARLGFLEWAICLEAERPADIAAQADLRRVPPNSAHSPAGSLFLTYLEDAASSGRTKPTRRGGRRRVLQ
ncbi:MAG: hypothetical protein ABJL99_17685 [Aliishimia sp.]